MASGAEDTAVPSPAAESPATVVSNAGFGKRDASAAAATASPNGDVDDVGPAAKRKKKAAGPGSRGVANLTPEQLAKKRANDREAQRAIRERTKNQIENLERKIEELTSQQPYQELQAVVRAKEAVERENAEIKRRLAAIIGDIQPLLGIAPELACNSPAQTYSRPTHSAVPPSLSAQASTPGSIASPGSTDPGSTAWQAQTPNSGDVTRSQLNQQRHELRHGLDLGPERLGLGFLLGSHHRVEKIQHGSDGAQDSPRYQHVPMKHDWTNVRHDQALRQSSWGSSPSSWPGETPRETSSERTVPVSVKSGDASAGQAPWSIPVKNGPPSCPLDSLLLDFLYERKQRAAEGLSAQEVVGPRYPSVSSLLNPSIAAYSHPLSKVFTDILSTFPDISTLPERVAVLYIMFLIMRWQISPTQENYERLPPWVRPVSSQLYSTHPAWIDHVPFPRMRDRLVRQWDTNQYPFDNFFIPFTTTLRLNWPYEETDTLLQSPETDDLMINPVFERHLRNLANWTLGEPFAKAFPTLAETCNIDYSVKAAKGR